MAKGTTLNEVQSVCPVCHKPVRAEYAEKDGAVYFQKRCDEHGEFETIVAENVEDYSAWIEYGIVNVPPKQAMAGGQADSCPLNCGTCTEHMQTACCVLIDVTDRCNQKCPYCFASANEDASNDPSLEEITKWYDRLIALGEERPFNIQLSGGEPTVRDDLPEIIRIGRAKGFEYIQLNTNGKRIAEEDGYAQKLKDAGTSVVYLQFDGMDDEVYESLRGEPLLATKLKAIENCKKARLPVTLVPTVVMNENLDQIGPMVEFMLDNLNVVKGIHFQPVSFFGRHPDTKDRVTMFRVMHEIEEQTDGLLKYDELIPISTGHQLCCFCASYLRETDGSLTAMMDKDESSSCCCGEPDPLDIIKRDRDFVLNKWEVNDDVGCYDPGSRDSAGCCSSESGDAAKCNTGSGDTAQESCCSDDESEKADCSSDEPVANSFDELLAYLKSNMFTISGMAFQDLSNLDAERVKRCRVQQYVNDGQSEKLIPFCGYNSIYRK